MHARIKVALIAGCFLFLLLPPSWAQAATHVEVAVDQLNIRSTPGTTAQIVGTITKAARLPIIKQQKEWTQVKLADGKTGWVINKYVKMIDIPQVKYVKSNVDMLNVRAEPNAAAQILQIIDKNGVYLQTKKQGDWAQIKLSDKVSGWVNARFLTETAAPAPKPTPAPAQTPAATQPPVLTQAPATTQPPALTQTPMTTQPPMTSQPPVTTQPPVQTQTPVPPTAPVVPAAPPPSFAPGNGQGSGTIVLREGLVIFSEPNFSSPVIGELNAGMTINHYGYAEGWYKINFNGVFAYIFNPDAGGQTGQGQPIGSPGAGISIPNTAGQAQASIRVKNPDTNLRSGPGTDYAVIGTVQPGEVYPIVQTEADWYVIRRGDNTTAYIAGWVVEPIQSGGQPANGTISSGVGYNHGMVGNETVYIYHTHNRESWRNVARNTKGSSVDDPVINITLVGKRLGELLQARGIPTMANQDDFAQKLAEQKKSYSLSYSESYKAVSAAAATSPYLKYIFDIHRDSDEPRSKVALTLNGKTYSRILFVIGTANPNYLENKKLAENLHARLEAAYPGLSRGIILKGANQGNGEYNQSISGGSLLLEFGGTNNTLEECYNTAEAFADVFVNYMLESQIAYN
ncbi:stage II sporulation protein P [Brevibacillus borstelensis]|uniref:stage II sporulation protein P n=1 Tax=Brevibacillus borstelensis TaxID=45462 RepID=UPI0030C38C57